MSMIRYANQGRMLFGDAGMIGARNPRPIPSISGPLAADLTVSGLDAATFTRSTTKVFTDYEGVLRTAAINEPVFEGGRRVENLCLNTEDLSAATWKYGATPTCTAESGFIRETDTNLQHYMRNDIVVPAGVYVISASVKGGGRSHCSLYPQGASSHFAVFNLLTGARTGLSNAISASIVPDPQNAGYYIIRITVNRPAGNLYSHLYISADGSSSPTYAGDITKGLYIKYIQIENITGSAYQLPSEYVPTTDAAKSKWFTTKPDGSPIYPVPKLLMEGQSQNVCLQSQAFGTSPWTQTNMGIAVDSIVAPDGTTTADTQIALADNATRVQTFTLASAAYTLSIYLKRKTGTGAISLSLDGGSTYTVVTLTSAWQRFNVTQTLANPSIVLKMAVSGDEIYAWGAQLEASPVPTSYMPTVASPMTRTADACSWPLSNELQAMLSIDKAWTTSLADETGLTWGADKNQSSFADGQSWFDHPDKDLSSFANAGKMMILRDSAGRLAWGFIGAAGAGQTLGSELLTNGGFDANTNLFVSGSANTTLGWNAGGYAVSERIAASTALAAIIQSSNDLVLKKLYVISAKLKQNTGYTGSAYLFVGNNWTSNYSGGKLIPVGADWTVGSAYMRPMLDLQQVRIMTQDQYTIGNKINIDDISAKEVLTPSAKGVYIYKDAARTQQGWNMEASFNMNGTAYTFDVVADCKAEGTVVLDWVPGSIPPASQIGIVSSNADVDSMLSVASSASTTRAYDATTAITGGATLVTGTARKLILRWNSATRQYRISSVAAGVVTHGTAGNFDGAFTLGANLLLHYSNAYPAKYSGLKLFKRYLTDNELLRLQ